jgi:hypothetical protein
VTDVESKLQQDITPVSDADSLFGPLASAVVCYLASIAMTAIATVVAVGLDSKVTIPNLSLIFVVPVIIAGVGLGLGPSLCSAILGALAFNFFLIEPRYSLAVDDPANMWAIGLLAFDPDERPSAPDTPVNVVVRVLAVVLDRQHARAGRDAR